MRPPRLTARADAVKIGEAAKQLNTTTRTLTYYEDEGFIRPKRTPKGTRLYSPDDLKRAEIVLALSKIGVHIRDIKDIALTRATCATGYEMSHKIVPILNELDADIDRRIEQLQALQRDVRRGAELIQTCWYCTKNPSRLTCPPCPVEAHLGGSMTARLVWDPDRG